MTIHKYALSFSAASRRIGGLVLLFLLSFLTAMNLGPTSETTSATSLAVGAVCTWNGTTGDWSDPSRWSCGVVPGAGDTAIVASGIVTVSSDATVGSLQLGDGTLTCNANLTVSDAMTWTKGTINGNATGKLTSNGVLNMSGTGRKDLTGGTLANNGTANWLGGFFVLASVFDNRPGATFAIQTNEIMSASGGSLINAGTMTKSDNSTTPLIGLSLNNTGTVNIDAGTLSLSGTLGTGANNTNVGGPFNIASGATLNLGFGTHTINPTGSVNGPGMLKFRECTTNFNGVFNVTGSLSFDVQSIVNFNTPTNITVLNLAAGRVAGSGAVTILNQMDWTGGDIQRSGSFTIQPNAILNFTGAGPKNLNSTLTNKGVANYLSASLFFNVGSVFDNRAGATFNIQTDSPLFGGGIIQNAGTIVKTGGAGTTIGCRLDNSGRLEISSTSLFFQSTFDQPQGDTVNQTGGVTHLNNGTLSANLTINGGVLSGIGTVTGNVTNSGALSPGLAAGAAGTITINRNYTQTGTGRLDIELGGTSPGVNSDLLFTNTQASTTATLAGTLNVSLINAFRPAVNSSIQIMRYMARSGSFATTNGMDLGGGQLLSANYLTNEVVLVSGDGGPGVPWVQVIPIPPQRRVFAPQVAQGSPFKFRYQLLVGNSGGQPAAVLVVVKVPPALPPGTQPGPPGQPGPGAPVDHDDIEDAISNDPLVPLDNPEDQQLFDDLSKRIELLDGTVLIPFIMLVPPQSTLKLPGGYFVRCPNSLPQPRGLGDPPPPLFPEPSVDVFGNLVSPSSDCVKKIIEFALDKALGSLPFSDCIGFIKDHLLDDEVATQLANNPTSLAAALASLLLDAAKCLAEFLPVAQAIKKVLDIIDLIKELNDVYEIFDACKGSLIPDPLVPGFKDNDRTQCVLSKDPNDKIGPDGIGASRFISGAESLRYAVFFENVPDATAPAQVVSIFDQLDPALLNFNTFALGPIAFADKQVTPPPNSSSFTTDVDMRPEKNLLVRVNANLNASTGLLTWSFTSIDPATGQPLPPDSPDGFLDPNVTPPEGDGSVLFFVTPKTGLPTGTVIRNRATIVFDQNESLDTPEWFNTIDNAKPTSNVLPLAASQCSSFRVEWSGSDATSGIAHYSIFVSKNGGPFEPWRLNTPQTSDFFNGVAGSTYAFHSVARDGAGNVEDPPAQPDTSTSVVTSMSINPTGQAFTAQGGNGIVDVQAPGGCNWIAVSKSFFINVTTGASGSGTGLVTFLLDPNPTNEARQGAIVIAGNRFIIDQAAGPATANQSPSAIDDTATTNQNTPVTIAVLANDSDPDGDSLTITNVSQASNGTVAVNADNTVTYSPNTGFAGTDSFDYTVSDGRGGTDTAAVAITVTLSNRAPVAACQNITRTVGPNCQAVVNTQDIGGSSSDPDGDAITLALTPAGPFTVGVHSVTLTVTDSHGTSATCSATVTVVDGTPPVIACPSNIVTSATAGQCAATVVYSATVTDNCSSATVTCSPSSGSSFNVGTTMVVCMATDAAGNTANCSFSVTVSDLQPPAITCPPNVAATAGAAATSAVVNYSQPQTADNCPGTTILCAPPSGASFPIGSTTVNCTATDASSNAAQCSFTVTVSGAPVQPDKIVFESSRAGNLEIFSMNADGTSPTRLTSHSALDFNPAWSPDRSKIAFTSGRTGNGDIYVMNADGTNQTRLTSTSAIEDDASWSPDGTKIAFWSSRDGNPEIYVMNADGTNQTRITSNSRWDTQPQWSPDGTKLVFVSNRSNLVNFDIYTMNADGSNVTRLTTNASIDESPDWSPDGTKIVFTSNRSNLLDFEIWLMNADGSNQTRLTSATRSSVRPTWSRDGANITFATNRHGLLNFEIYTMNANGTSQTRITTNSAIDFNPDR